MINNKEYKLLKKIFLKDLEKTRKNHSFSNEDFQDLKSLKSKELIYFDKLEKNEFMSLIVHNLSITLSGINYLRDKKINSKKWNNEHDKILYTFMEILDKNKDILCFSDFDLGNRRPDILTINKTNNKVDLNPIIYEIKHSRNDFFADIKNPDKRKTYISYSEKLYYVCKENLIKENEVPNETGLIYLLQNGEIKKIKEPDIVSRKVSNDKLIELIMTLIIRSLPGDIQPQVSLTKEKNFKIDNVEKYIARNFKNSFIFSSNHKQTLKEINLSSYLRINFINEKYYEDLFFWGLIEKSEQNVKLTEKGLQILLDQKEQHEKTRQNVPTYFDATKNVIIPGHIVKKDNVDYITIPITKKLQNIIIKYYLKNEEDYFNFIDINNLSEATQFFKISEPPFIQKNKNVGLVSPYKNSRNEYCGIYIEKRAKKQIVCEEKIIDLIIKVLLNYSINNKSYILYH